MDFKLHVGEKLQKATGMELDKVLGLIETPPDERLGDAAFPCFSLSRTLRKAPVLIAQEICSNIEADEYIEKINVASGYVNFYYNRKAFVESIISDIYEKGTDYGKSSEGNGKKIIVEFSSPNIAKPFHIGHLFTTAIGSSLQKIFSFLGYETVSINHLGDWGTQFGKLICAYERWGNKELIDNAPINELLKIYVKFHDEAKLDPSLDEEARKNFKKLEENDPDAVALWSYFREVSLKEFNKVYELLGVNFDSFAGESYYTDKMPAVVETLKSKNLLVESEGAYIVNLDDQGIPPSIIIKSDGATIYATRDLAAAIYRKQAYDFYKNIYVVGNPQTLHFKQVFAILNKMDHQWAKDCVHVGFGMVKFPDKKLSTRNGDVVFLEEVLFGSIQKTKEIIVANNNINTDDIDEVAKKIGVGAILYTFLKNSREKDIVFSWEDILDFEGESAPCVQYSYARCKSILRKAKEASISYEKADLTLITSDEEYQLVKLLNNFYDVVKEASVKYEPSCITRYVTDLAQQFNRFYNNCPIMKSDGELKKARLMLTEVTSICIKSALSLLGIDVVEKM